MSSVVFADRCTSRRDFVPLDWRSRALVRPTDGQRERYVNRMCHAPEGRVAARCSCELLPTRPCPSGGSCTVTHGKACGRWDTWTQKTHRGIIAGIHGSHGGDKRWAFHSTSFLGIGVTVARLTLDQLV